MRTETMCRDPMAAALQITPSNLDSKLLAFRSFHWKGTRYLIS